MSVPDTEATVGLKAFPVGEDAAGTRLDQWLAAKTAPDLSRNRVQAIIRGGDVRIDGKVVREPKARLVAGTVVTLGMPEPEPAEPEAETIDLAILFEDEDLIVIDKPAGLVVHPGAGNWTGTLVNALIHHCDLSLSGIGGVRRPGIVHRLDKETSGVLVVAKNDLAHRALSDAFADHGRTGDLERAYHAVLWGVLPRRAGIVDAPLGRSGTDRTKRAVVPEGRPDARHAVTHYQIVEKFGPKADATAFASLVECRLETGRTHQIRVHMAHVGHPLIGDQTYGRAFKTKANKLPDDLKFVVGEFPRQALHARLLQFRHPRSGEILRFEAPYPPDFAELVEALRRLPFE
ncbi:RluA family pseudouridine synthase [Mesorhizobium sp. YIM 152430]|uniref:RluA family pseudouridine synthase n=1 Tax=Mesorhizobium sp. YIM 152430 TaxID=3031761 RepID=UPI0023DA3B2C|nr:RluA family pseudouridine synthase [Mesorhizobium sp. YIM 152430]MDF1599268.1 RluA family pseudouridine synthase [Mesorhizobium sp. YIM 152430]